jgi:PilZ domain
MLCSLLLTRDDAAARVIARVFRDLEVECEHCSESGIAIQSLGKKRFDALVIDDSVEEAATVLTKLLEIGQGKSVRILLADSPSNNNEIFKTSTQVVLYKPLSLDRVRHGLRAVRNLMARDRRRGMKRVSTMINARVRQGRSGAAKIFISDLSDSGAALQCGSLALPSGNLEIDFSLPDDSDRIHLMAELVWRDNRGGAGIRFIDMASSARKRLAQWLKQESEKTETQGRLAMAKSMGL